MILFTVLFWVIWRCDSSVCLFLTWIYVRVWMLMILWCVLEKVREKKDGIVDRISRSIYHVNTSVLFSGDPKVTTLLGNSHAPPTHTHREKIAKREKSANISIAFPMASVQSWSESGFSEKGWVSLRTSSALSKTYSYVERSPNAVVVMLK